VSYVRVSSVGFSLLALACAHAPPPGAAARGGLTAHGVGLPGLCRLAGRLMTPWLAAASMLTRGRSGPGWKGGFIRL